MMSMRMMEGLLVAAGFAAILFAVGACQPAIVTVEDNGTTTASGGGVPHSDPESRTDNAGHFVAVAGDAGDDPDAKFCTASLSTCVNYVNINPPVNVSCGSASEIPADTPEQEQTMLFCNGDENFIHECTDRVCDQPHPVPGPPVDTVVCNRGDCGVAAFTNPNGGGLQGYDLAQNQLLDTVMTPGCSPSALDLEGDFLYASCAEAGEVWVFPFDQNTGTIGARTSVISTCSAPSSIDVTPNLQIGATTCTEGLGVIDLVAGETPIILPCAGCFDVVVTDDATCAYGVGDDINGFNLDNFVRFATLPPPPGATYTAIGRSPGETSFYVALSSGEVGLIDRNVAIRGVAPVPDITINVILTIANHPN